jgi:ABC-type multidrug transport system permease subunit
MHPFLRNVVIGVVGLLIAAGLTAMAVLGDDTGLSVVAMLGSALIAAAIGVFLFVQGWIWSQRAYRSRSAGMSVWIALGGGLMIVLAAVALAGAVILVVLFYL